MSILEYAVGDEYTASMHRLEMAAELSGQQDRMTRPSTPTTRPSKFNLLKHRVLYSSAWVWNKFGLRLLCVSGGILLIYAIVFVLWFHDAVEKCRIPYHEKLTYNSYFGGGVRVIAQNYSQQLTLLPGLVCVPEVETDYITATWNDLMDVWAHIVEHY